MGLDGQSKMSKSLGNTIGLLEEPDEMWAKLRPAVTDPRRIKRSDPGTPEVCNIYHLHQAFSPPDLVATVARNCRTAGWGCLDCKRALLESMNTELTPIRRRARELRDDPASVDDALAHGAARAREMARETIGQVRGRMGFDAVR
jgi:tryptophanyl-tRNA synthetase